MMNKSLSEAHIFVLRRFKSIRVYLYLLGLFVGISVKICEIRLCKGEQREQRLPLHSLFE